MTRSLRPVADTYEAMEVLDDLTPGGAAVDATFSRPVDLVWIMPQGGDARVTGSDDTPTTSHGIPVLEDTPFPVPFHTSSVKVFAAGGVTVTVWGQRYLA